MSNTITFGTDPWKLEDAFDPMFNEDIEIYIGGTRVTVKCAIFVDSNGEVLSDDMLDTDRRDINIFIRQRDWVLLKNVNVNDIVRRTVGGNVVEYAVSELVDDMAMGKIIKARSTSVEED